MSSELTAYYLLILLIMHIKYSNTVSNGQLALNQTRGNMVAKIVGGTPVSLDRYPSMVLLYNHGDMCGGNIINSWTILTAAHCFDLHKEVKELMVQIGTRYVYDLNADTYSVNSLVIHEKYNESQNFECDIALLFLSRNIIFTKVAKKGILVNNAKWMSSRESNFTVTGWGMTQYGGKVSKKNLLMTNLRFIPSDECGRMHAMTFSRDMFCLYGEGARDTCKGDSGGGVLWRGLIVGITSHGDGCARKHKPSVYANVFYFREWIKHQVYKYMQTFCNKKLMNS